MHAVALATLLELTLARSSVDTSVMYDFYRRTREPYSKTAKQYLSVTPNPPRHPCTQASSSVHNERQATAYSSVSTVADLCAAEACPVHR